MPGLDRTGPLRQRLLTGRGFGPCGGFGFRRFGTGFRRRFQLTETDEKKILEAELQEIEEDKKEIGKRLKELK